MEYNKRVEQKLTSEQKVRFQRDNGKFRLLENIVIIPVITTILGIYLDSFPIVCVSIICIIIFLAFKITAVTRKNVVFDEVIVPIVLEEMYDKVTYVKRDDDVLSNFEKSGLVPAYDKIKVNNQYRIKQDKYIINMSKITTQKLNIEENDGEITKDYEVNFCGIFASVKLPSKSSINFKAIEKGLEEEKQDLVKITNMEFDYCYDVFSKDPVEVRSILSPGVMARMIEFNSKIGLTVNFSVCEDMLYIGVNYDNFLNFRDKGRKYVVEEDVVDNMKVLEVIENYVRYFCNMYEAQ